MPALLTSAVSLPNASTAHVDSGVPLLGIVTSSGRSERPRRARRKRLAFVIEDVADDHFSALGDERPCVGAPIPRRR